MVYSQRLVAALMVWAVCGMVALALPADLKPPPRLEDSDWVADHDVADPGRYTCTEKINWVSKEKHYSNDNRKQLFETLKDDNCSDTSALLFRSISFSKRGGYQLTTRDQPACGRKFKTAVIFLSNFSINNNFSHFLHGLLRLFCALVDSGLIVWDRFARSFVKPEPYSIWFDDNLKLDPVKLKWFSALSYDGSISMGKTADSSLFHLKDVRPNECVSAERLVYGSGCVRLLPPEKWFGYGGCRAHQVTIIFVICMSVHVFYDVWPPLFEQVAPAFGYFMRSFFGASGSDDLVVYPDTASAAKVRIAFAVRDAGTLTGRRIVSNIETVQSELRKATKSRIQVENMTFEYMDVPSTVQFMSKLHVFVSVHGAGMTNIFFMSPGAAVVEIIPFPLCTCRSPDYFYGLAGYYHGMALAMGLRYYSYCVPKFDQIWFIDKQRVGYQGPHRPAGAEAPRKSELVRKHVPQLMSASSKCSWRQLHAVDTVELNVLKFSAMIKVIERDFVSSGLFRLGKDASIVTLNPHANG